MANNGENGEAKNSIMTISNVITIVRIGLVPVFVAALLCPWPEWWGLTGISNDVKAAIAAALFVIISGTDWLDGYLARKRDEVTDFGKFMDPLADKILVSAALISLVELGTLPTWVVLIILAREFIISGVRMMAATKGRVIAASYLGKFKTVSQMIAIVLFTIKDIRMPVDISTFVPGGMYIVSWFVMIVALVLTVVSLVDYLMKARDVIGLGRAMSGGGALRAEDAASVAEDTSALAADIVSSYAAAGLTCAVAESLTGGKIGQAITSVPGASDVFRGGVISYVDQVKHDALGVSWDVLNGQGAVSEECACQMAEGARRATGADVAVSVTGIAGPGGAEPGKPVGTVWIGVSDMRGTQALHRHFMGSRDDVRALTVRDALQVLLDKAVV